MSFIWSAEIVLVALPLLICIGVYFWALNRGFDISDEAIFFLQAQRPRDVRCYPFFDFVYTAPIFKLTRESIVFHRLLVLLGQFVATAIFFAGIWAALHEFFPGSVDEEFKIFSLGLLLFVTLFASQNVCIRLLHYNQVNGMAVLASNGLLFLLLFGSLSHSFSIIIPLLIGAIFAFQVFCKISSALTSICASFLFVLLVSGWGVFEYAHFLVLVSLGAVCHCLFHFTLLQGPRLWWEAFSTQVELSKAFDWGVGCIPRHLSELGVFLRRQLADGTEILGLSALALIAIGITRVNSGEVAGAMLLWSLLAWSLILKKFVTHGLVASNTCPLKSTVGFLFRLLLGIAPLVVVSCELSGMRESSISFLNYDFFRYVVITSYLLTLPFVGAIGTGNPVFVNFTYQLAPWSCLLYLVFYFQALTANAPWLLPFGVLVLSLGISIYFLSEFILRPYRLNDSLLKQTVPIEIGPFCRRILVDKESALFFLQIKDVFNKNGFKPGDDIVALYDMPGVVYALGGVSPGHQWYYTMPRHRFEILKFNHFNLGRVTLQRRQDAFLLESGEIDEFLPFLADLSIDFPSSYLECGKVRMPYFNGKVVTLWKPRRLVVESDWAFTHIEVEKANEALLVGNFQDACFHVGKALERSPDSVDLLTHHGNLLLRLGLLGDAQQRFETAISQAPNHVSAHQGLATLHLHTANLDKAISHALKCHEIEPENDLTKDLVKEVFKRSGAMPPSGVELS